jgi:hypothetical protein
VLNGAKFLTRFSAVPITALIVIAAASAASAHDDHCTAVTDSVADAGFDGRVTVTCTDSHAIIQSDTYPDHEKMTGIVGTNEQVPVPADYAAPILLSPAFGSTALTRDAASGVAVNGVPIYVAPDNDLPVSPDPRHSRPDLIRAAKSRNI